MTETKTPAGTPVLDFDAQEYANFLEGEVCGRMELSVTEFTERYLAGTLDEADPDVPMLAGLLWMGQHGHRPSAA